MAALRFLIGGIALSASAGGCQADVSVAGGIAARGVIQYERRFHGHWGVEMYKDKPTYTHKENHAGWLIVIAVGAYFIPIGWLLLSAELANYIASMTGISESAHAAVLSALFVGVPMPVVYVLDKGQIPRLSHIKQHIRRREKYYMLILLAVGIVALLMFLNDPPIILDGILVLSYGIILPGLALLTGLIVITLVIGGLETAHSNTVNRRRKNAYAQRSRQKSKQKRKPKRKPKRKNEWLE